jgi:hypothetical protein
MNESPMYEPPINPTEYVHIIGVFRAKGQADEAIVALKEAGFEEDKILVTDYHSEQAADTRFIVHVMAADREQEAVGILTHHGANNSDLPPGTEMVHGDLTLRDPHALPSLSQQPTTVEPDALPMPTELDEAR